MPTWPYRYQLSLQDRVRRSVYELLRDQMDTYLLTHALIGSYESFRGGGEPYPFVTKRELKPRARVVEKDPLLRHQQAYQRRHSGASQCPAPQKIHQEPALF